MRRFSFLAFVLILLGVVGCDHATKHVAQTELAAHAPRAIVPGVLDLTYAPNTDTAFSLLGGHLAAGPRMSLLVVISALVTLGVAVFIARRWKQSSRVERVAAALVLGGALGNGIDRAFRGQVIDFIHVRYWPVFNVADIAVVVGAGLLLFATRKARAPAGA